MIQKVPKEAVLKNKGGQEDWTHFKKEILSVKEQPSRLVFPLCAYKQVSMEEEPNG